MSDYGLPPGPPPGPSGPPSGPSGPPSSGSGSHAVSGSTTSGAGDGSAGQVAILTYAATVLGLLGFIWGFLDWLTRDNGVGGSTSATGYESPSAAAGIGLLLVAGLVAGVTTLEKKTITLAPAAVAVAALLVILGVLIDHGDGINAGIGLILAFITAILQTAALVVAWLLANDRMPALGGGGGSKTGSSNQWQQGPGQQGPGQQGPGQFGGFGGDQGPGQFGPPPGYGPPPGPPPGYGPPPQDQGPSYGPPSGPPPGYGPPSAPHPAPSGQPSGPPTGSPSGPPPGEDDASRTQVLPRFQPDQNSTQQGSPLFDPQSRPDERSGEQERPNYGR